MRRTVLAGIAIAFLIALIPSVAMAAAIPPPPYRTAGACLSCHAVQNSGPVINQVDFEVPTVDRNACNACHWLSSHPGHSVGDDCADCHTSWPSTGRSLPFASSVQTPFGWFSSAGSAVTTDSAYLHQVHGRRAWAADVTSRPWGCGSCHAAASCAACHTGGVPHDAHPLQNGNPSPAAPYADVATGAPVGATSFPASNTFAIVSCAAADCHQGIGPERITEDSSPSVIKVGTWTVRTATSSYKVLGGTAVYTSSVGASITVPFSGNQVSLWGWTGYNAGAAEIYIDDVYVETKDFYESGLRFGNGVWDSPGRLAEGPHTLRIVTKASIYGSNGTLVYFDRIVARDLVEPTQTSPTCLTCHPEREPEHGYDAFDHVSDSTSTADPALGGKTCGECHSMDLTSAHVVAGGCEVCHAPVGAGTTLTAEGAINPDHLPGRWNQTCEACHSAANPVLGADKHGGLASHEASGVAADADCLGCHGTSGTGLPAIHTSAETTVDVDSVPTRLTSCDVCHKNPDLTRPLTNDCTSCHFTMADHPGADHTSTYPMDACGGAGCHTSVTVVSSTETTQDLVAIHGDFRAFACGECHASSETRYRDAIAAGNTSCDACHDEPGDHYDVHGLDPLLVDETGPRYAYGTGSVPGGEFTEDCTWCHTSNIVDEHLGLNGQPKRYRDDGTQIGCGDCHGSTDLRVLQAIQAGSASPADYPACDDCHVSSSGTPVHLQMSEAHASGFLGGAGEGLADIDDIHAALPTTTPAGTTVQLKGCTLCHSYFTSYDTAESRMGTRTQTAISAGETGCDSCHTTGMMTAKHVAPDSAGCTRCHTKTVTELHAGSVKGACAVCHDNPVKGDVVSGKADADCTQSGCHASEGVDYHLQMDARHTSPTGGTCYDSGCHEGSRDLRVVHASFVATDSENPQYETTCDLCHLNDDPDRIDWSQPVSAGCTDDCHASPNHTGMSAGHTVTDTSAECSSCHGTDVVRTHDAYANLEYCDRCHGDKTNWSRTVDCAGCHVTRFPPEDAHYSDSTHTAAPFTAAAQGATVPAGGEECSGCHSAVLPAAHSTTTTSAGSVTCVECHTDTLLGSSAVVAADWPTKTCVSCHDAATAPSKTHAQYGTAHVVAANGCAGSGAGCHDSGDLAELHASAQNGGQARYDSCYNTDPNDPLSCHVTRDDRPAALPIVDSCGTGSSGCHQDKSPVTHGAHTLNVTGSDYSNTTVAGCTNSGAGCHDTETRADAGYENPYHPYKGCATSKCHTSASFASHDNPLACQDCHDGTYATAPDVETLTAVPASGGHYSETTHAAVTADRTGTVTSGGTVTAGCVDCHDDDTGTLKGIWAQHQNLPGAYGDTTCADCHNYSAGVSAEIDADWTNDKCADCHNAADMPGLAQHGATAPVVDGASAAGCASSGASCHPSADLHALHKGKTGGKVTTCALSGCHDFAAQGLKPVKKSCGTGGDCHASGDPHSEHVPGTPSSGCTGAGCHDESKAGVPAPGGELKILHAQRPEGACNVCHDNPDKGDLTVNATTYDCQQSGCHGDVTANHEAMHDTTGVIDPGCQGCHFTNLVEEHDALGYTCDTCHRSTNSSVVAAISRSDLRCDACHPAVNGKDRHANQRNNEFIGQNLSMHRAYDSLPGARTSFVVNGATYSWSLPTNFLKTGWTTSSVVTCFDCHTFGSTAAGPHGAAVAVNIDPAYPVKWSTARVDGARSGSSRIICDKCHQNIPSFNKVHNTGDHDGYACNQCHSPIPHGWRLPRLLAYTTDPAPYRTVTGGLQQIALKSYSPSGWSESDCYAACAGDHDRRVSSVWPSTGQTVGTLTGTVRDDTNAVLSGVAVTTDKGQSTTTDASGRYTFTGIATGVYQVTAAKSGHVSQTKAGTVNTNQTTTVDITLSRLVTAAVGGRVTSAATGAGIAGATVSLGGGFSATTGGDGSYSIADVPLGGYTMTVSATGYESATQPVTVVSGPNAADVALTAETSTNLARGKTFTASASNSSYPPSRAGDGSYTTYWQSTSLSSSSATRWLQVDLGSVAVIDKLVVGWNGTGYYARSYQVQYASSASGPWTTVSGGSVTSGTSATRTFNLTAPVAARYWRVNCTAYNSSSGYRMYEFEVWGAPASPGTISGTVTSGGSPVSGATVSGDGLTATTDAGGGYIITGVTAGTYNLTASRAGYTTSAAKTVTVTSGGTTDADFTLTPVPVNAARTGTFAASSEYSGTYAAGSAGDGSYTSYWRSTTLGYSNTNQWLRVDLGSAKTIDKVVVGWNGQTYYAEDYQIQYASSTSGPWTTITGGAVSNSESSANRTFALTTPVTARYWRVNCTGYNNSAGYRIYEFEVWTP